MKHLKMLGIAVAAIAAMAVIGAGAASATVLCTETGDPCPAGEDYASGTTVHAVLESGKHFTINGVWTDVTCKSSTIQGKTESTGGEGASVKIPIESLTFGECSCSGGFGTVHVTVLNPGSLKIHHISGSDDGTLTGEGQLITFNCTNLGTQCKFGTAAEGTDLGTLTGGNPATVDGSATWAWSSGTSDEGTFICGTTAKWEATYEITSPKPLYVAATAKAGGGEEEGGSPGGVLCKTAPTESGACDSDYASGTTIHAVLESGKHFTINGFWTDITCKSSTIQGKTESTGEKGTVKVPIEALTFGECSCGGGSVGGLHVTVLETGSLKIHHISGSDDGTLTGEGQTFTFNCTSLGSQCRYGTAAEGTDLGTVTGGNPATIDGSATWNWSSGASDEGSFLCGSTAKWEATYEITSPKPLYVAAG